jgi:hypothetical protein
MLDEAPLMERCGLQLRGRFLKGGGDMLRNVLFVVLAAMILSLTGCGGGSGGNNAATADAGHAQSVLVGAAVTLDGSASSSADGSALSYQWSILSKPAGSAATLANPTSVRPTLIADLPGTYLLNLAVSDGEGNASAATVPVTASEAIVTIAPSSADGTFVITGAGLQKVVAVQLDVGFDSSTLGRPVITLGGMLDGMMSAINSNSNPVRLAAIGARAIGGNGAGPLATVSFQRPGSSPGTITTFTGKLLDVTGRQIDSQFLVLPQ